MLAEQTLLPLAVRRAGVDILHNLFTTAPVLHRVPQQYVVPGSFILSWLLAWGARVGLRPCEALLSRGDLVTADEAFLSSSVAGILPVTRFEGAAIGDGAPGQWTRRARADREAMIVGPGAGPGSGDAGGERDAAAPGVPGVSASTAEP